MKNILKNLAVIAPSGYLDECSNLDYSKKYFFKKGFNLHSYFCFSGKFERFAARDEERLNNLHNAVKNKNVDLVMALRGGYGLSRLLPNIDFELLANSKKLFIGYSDFTVLQLAMLSQTGTITFSGPMIYNDFLSNDISEFTSSNFWNCILKDRIEFRVNESQSHNLEIKGTIWGGNLSIINHLSGTKWLPIINDGILFVEDINEHPYRIERMILQLYHSGILDMQKAIIFGEFSGYKISKIDNGYNFDSMLNYLQNLIKIPILKGLPVGHIKDKLTLPIGAKCKIKVDNLGFNLNIYDYPYLIF